MARAHVVNASSLFAYAEVLVEDSEGRQIAHGGGQAAFLPVEEIEVIEDESWHGWLFYEESIVFPELEGAMFYREPNRAGGAGGSPLVTGAQILTDEDWRFDPSY